MPRLLDEPRSPRYFTIVPSPVGELLLTGDGETLTELSFAARNGTHEVPSGRRDDGALRTAVQELEAYFAGELREFSLMLAPGGTPFQREVWSHLLTIPYGATESYADVAGAIGRERATRAVGLANGRNPIAIIVPCHRVIGKNGSLTGYGGGLDRKQWLLTHERIRFGPQGV